MFSELLGFIISHYLNVNSIATLLGLETKFYLINLEFFFIAFTMSFNLSFQ